MYPIVGIIPPDVRMPTVGSIQTVILELDIRSGSIGSIGEAVLGRTINLYMAKLLEADATIGGTEQSNPR